MTRNEYEREPLSAAINARVTEAVYDFYDRLATVKGVSMADVVRWALDAYKDAHGQDVEQKRPGC